MGYKGLAATVREARATMSNKSNPQGFDMTAKNRVSTTAATVFGPGVRARGAIVSASTILVIDLKP